MDNINAYCESLKSFFTKSELDSFRSELVKSKDNLELFIPSDTITLNYNYKYPQKIAIIIDGGVMSAAEMLVTTAKQSKKVIVVGTHTEGGMII